MRPSVSKTSSPEQQISISKEWASQFAAKQYLKKKYVLSERNLKTMVKQKKPVDHVASNIIAKLDQRLDVIVYTLGWGATIKEARHLIKRGKIFMEKEGKRPLKLLNPGVRIQLGETIKMKANSPAFRASESKAENKGRSIQELKEGWRIATIIQPMRSNLGQRDGSNLRDKFELFCTRW